MLTQDRTPLMAALDSLPTTGDEQTLLIAAKCRGLMIGYDNRWKNAGWETISVEQVFHLPVINPETGHPSRTFQQAGKYDGIIAREGRDYLLEHKTTSEDISDPNSSYWRRLVIDSQVSAYVLANWQDGRKLDGTVYDVIKKPGIRPKQLTNAECKEIVQGGTYLGYQLSEELRCSVVTSKQVEPLELYSIRLTDDTLNNPQKYFCRRVIPRMDSEIVEYAKEVWEVGQSIMHARSRDAHYRNSEACVTYGAPCQFLGICSGHDTPESENWRASKTTHPELNIEYDGKNLLTNSRIKTFQSCRRKHFYKYEMGIERQDQEEKESLYFGRMLHSALEAWWSAYIPKGHENVNVADAATGNELVAATREAR